MLIDFRSDTVTRPTPEMLEAMFHAKAGDDVFGDDPSVNALEEKAAALFGMEAALFCTSGTMTNQIAIKVHTQPGDEVICDRLAHVYAYEGGGIAYNSGCSVKLPDGDRGRLSVQQVTENINAENVHFPRTKLVCLENTVNRGGGCYYDINVIKGIRDVCNRHRLGLHLDGARIFNALAETGESPGEYGQWFDSISVCFSKGLGAPVGSVLLGRKEFIKQARRIRKVMGGGWRQAGYLAAAAIYALDHHVDRLKDDHRKAFEIHSMLKELDYVEELLPQDTNIVIFKLKPNLPSESFIKQMQAKNILVSAFGYQNIRMVTHLDIKDEMLSELQKALKAVTP